MKISASIYSDKNRNLEAVIADLAAHQVELLHVDCNDEVAVFEDIKRIRTWCTIPIDLHIITDKPSKFFPLLLETPVEYLTFQFENLVEPLLIPKEITGKKGIAITTHTSINAFNSYPKFDFILIMATIPGQSGGLFDKHNFSKIRSFRNQYPSKSIHVDGGVNGEVSFILRNMGVSTSVSGSYLFNAPSIGHALMNLTKREMESQFKVSDFMTPIAEAPFVMLQNCSTKLILETVETGNLGFCLVIDEDKSLVGIVSSADIRKALLRKIDAPQSITTSDLINRKPRTLNADFSVVEMLQYIKKCPFPIMYLPVIGANQEVLGIVNFAHLIKGEL